MSDRRSQKNVCSSILRRLAFVLTADLLSFGGAFIIELLAPRLVNTVGFAIAQLLFAAAIIPGYFLINSHDFYYRLSLFTTVAFQGLMTLLLCFACPYIMKEWHLLIVYIQLAVIDAAFVAIAAFEGVLVIKARSAQRPRSSVEG